MAFLAIRIGSFSPSSVYTGTWIPSPRTFNCSMAAGRNVSHAARSTFMPLLLLMLFASLAENVVLPEPFRPATRTIPGLPLMLMSCDALPMKSASSSWTILTIICCGFTAVRTFCPMALTFTLSQKSLATRKLTSASSSALRMSFSVSATLISVILPSPFRILKDLSSLSCKLSNIFSSLLIVTCKDKQFRWKNKITSPKRI